MPLIEELPVTSTAKASHGWAYVPDTGPIAAQQPGTRNDRKRTAAITPRGAASTTAKREKAIQQRLESLNKENYKDGVSVPIPARPGRDKSGKKVTNNVRRILAYQRNFKHYLDEEESLHPGATHYTLPAITTGMGPPPTPATATTTSKDAGRRKSARPEPTQPSPANTPKPRGTKRSRQASESAITMTESDMKPEEEAAIKTEETTIEPQDTSMPDAPPPPPEPDYPPEWDNDPLLRSLPSEVPPMPSDRIMQILISEPPLTYNAARATPLDEDKRLPPQHFCCMCGYFGKVRCKKCEDWTCGLMECWKSHEATCPMANAY